MPEPSTPSIAAPSMAVLRALLARTGGAHQHRAPPIRFGLPALDSRLPGGGLARAALHEAACAGPEIEHAAAACLFVAGLCAGLAGVRPLLWVLERGDLFAPALAGVGLHPDRVIYAEAGQPKRVLQAMEDALRHGGLAAVVGELSGALSLTASRRLQLACEASATPAFLLRRSRRHDDPALAAPSAAATRWRIAALPSGPAMAQAAELPGLAPARWQLELLRCRGGAPHTWIVEACDAQGRLGLPAQPVYRPAAAPARRAADGPGAGHRAA